LEFVSTEIIPRREEIVTWFSGWWPVCSWHDGRKLGHGFIGI